MAVRKHFGLCLRLAWDPCKMVVWKHFSLCLRLVWDPCKMVVRKHFSLCLRLVWETCKMVVRKHFSLCLRLAWHVMEPVSNAFAGSLSVQSLVLCYWNVLATTFEPPHDKTNKMACAPSEDSDHPGHPPSLIRVFVVHMKKFWVLSYPLSAQRRLWSDWADGQADLCLRWAHIHFVGFVLRRLVYVFTFFNSSSRCHRQAATFDYGIAWISFFLSLFWPLDHFDHYMSPVKRICVFEHPSLQILTAHAQPFRGARDLTFCLKVPLDSLLVWASSGGSGEIARMRRLAWTFATRIGDKYQIRLTRSNVIDVRKVRR